MEEETLKIDTERIPEFFRPYFLAKSNGTLPDFYLDRLRRLRDDYSDEIPEVKVDELVTLDEKGHFVGDNYKCRGNYIFGLGITLESAINDGVITDSEIVKKIEQFRHHDFRYHHA